jgi:uncharacterized protein YbjT (DUF2867 family)
LQRPEILVLAATGKTGRRVTERLRQRGHSVRAASRTSTTRFDWNDRATWGPTLDGVDAVYLVAHDDPEAVGAFVTEAVDRGVERFVGLSGRGNEVLGEPGMLSVEREVQRSGVAWTVLRPNHFAQNFDEDIFLEPLLAGELALPVGDGLEPFVDVHDIADVAVEALTEDGHQGRTYVLSGPRALTFDEAVATIAEVTGRPMRFRDLTPEDYIAEQVAAGLPEGVARFLDRMWDLTRTGHNVAPTDDVERVIGRPAGDFRDYVVRAAATSWRSPLTG